MSGFVSYEDQSGSGRVPGSGSVSSRGFRDGEGSRDAGLFDSPGPGSSLSGRALCEALIRADSEAEVESVLRDVGYWDDIDAWTVFGGNEANASVIGGQQASPEAALVEKIVNSIDARLLDACRQHGLEPRSGADVPGSGLEAVSAWFDHGMNTDQVSKAGNVMAWGPGKLAAQADRITVTATGPTDGYASITVADEGEGQEPDAFADTFCSLNTGNKRSIPFVQGKHTMGGTGALRFCGAGRVHAHNLQLIVSRRNPAYASAGERTPWGFTVVRRFPEQANEKTPTYRYLTPKGAVLRFEADALAIFPQRPDERGQAEPYARAAGWGTLTKLYEYIKGTYITRTPDDSPKARLSLLRNLELRMPNAMLPVKLYECRPFKAAAKQRPTMVLTGIMGRLHNLANPSESLEWDGAPKLCEFRVDKQLIRVAVWVFKKPAGSWRGPHGVLFTLNGQTHATLPDSFFGRADVGMDPLRKSLLVVVDCSDISSTHESALMMTSRDRLADSEFAKQIKSKLAEDLKAHPALKKLRNERLRFRGDVDEQARSTVRDLMVKLVAGNPDLGKLLIDGDQIANPHQPFGIINDPPVLRQFPTFFRLRKAKDGHLHRNAHLGLNYHRFIFETDAQDDYFDRVDAPGARCLDMKDDEGAWLNADRLIDGWHLSEGVAEMRLLLPAGATAGDVFQFKFTVFDHNHETTDFVSTIELCVLPKKDRPEPPDDRPDPKPKPKPIKGDVPEIREVREEQWAEQVPAPFNADTALRRNDNGEGGYELRYNGDNKWLSKEVSLSNANDSQAADLRHQFGVVMAALGMAVMAAHQRKTNSQQHHEDPAGSDPDDNDNPNTNVNELIEWTTEAVAPVVASIHNLTAAALGAHDSD